MAAAAQLNNLGTALVRLGFSVDGAVDITADQGHSAKSISPSY